MRFYTTSAVVISSSCILLSIRTASALASRMPTKKSIVVVGGGIQGTSVAYHLASEYQGKKNDADDVQITILEAVAPASAASGKGGGFMARSWGDGTPTQRLHELAFDMYENLATELGCESYRKLPVLSVTPGYQGIKAAKKDKNISPIMPGWLDGSVGRISAMVCLDYDYENAKVSADNIYNLVWALNVEFWEAYRLDSRLSENFLLHPSTHCYISGIWR